MKKIGLSVMVIIKMIAMVAQGQTTTESVHQYPLVPLSIVAQGSQAVASHLLFQIDHVSIKYSGKSMLNESRYEYDLAFLRQGGYVDGGSFKQFSDALETLQFSTLVIPQPSNYEGTESYNVKVELDVYNKLGEIILQGEGQSIITREKAGPLKARPFEPVMFLPEKIRVDIEDNIHAMIVGWYIEEYLEVIHRKADPSSVLLETYLLGSERNLVLHNGKSISSWNLSTGERFEGEKVFINLGALNGSDIQLVKDDLYSHGRRFFMEDWQIYGNFPLLDFVTESATKIGISDLRVSVWGTDMILYPQRAFIRPVGTAVEWELPPKGFFISPGEYHIRTVWGPEVKSWVDNPKPPRG